MYFQVLDNKQECYSFYKDGKIYLNDIPDNIERTWNITPYLVDKDIKFAQVLVEGKRIKDIVPDHLAERWQIVYDRKMAYLNSFIQSKVDLNKHCFYDLVPQYFLYDYCEIKNKVTKYVFENYDIPENHDFMVDLHDLLFDIESRKLNLDWSCISLSNISNPHRFLRLKQDQLSNQHISYNAYGTVTGRLTVHSRSFPILNLDREFRSIVRPNNDYLVEFDYNAAELRVMMLLASDGKEAPTIDMHEFNKKEMGLEGMDRDEIKTEIFKWLYNPNNHQHDEKFNKLYKKDEIITRFYLNKEGETGIIKTPFGRNIEADDYHALNYMLQSTTSDLLLDSAIKVKKLLEGCKSYIAFTVHDSMVLDFSEDDVELLSEIKNIMENTRLGYCMCNISVGKNYGEMNL